MKKHQILPFVPKCETWLGIRPIFVIGFILALFIVPACNLPAMQSPASSGSQMMQDTQGNQAAGQMIESAHSTRVAIEVQATVVAQQVAQLTALANSPTGTPPPVPTLTAMLEPTKAPAPTETPMPTPTEAQPPTEIPASPTPDFEAWMETANILLFEDISGIYLQRYIKEALDGMGLSYVDVKDAVGDFKSQLLSGTDWDLIITGVEARSGVKGEFFDYIGDELNKGTSVILEIWTLDEIAGGRIGPMLTQCGIKFQKDWWEPPDESRSVWWLAPEHPVFHEPNEGMSLAHYGIQWYGDAGDLIKKLPGSDATLLAGTLAWEKDNHGTLATCYDGRFIIQTHSSHDYYAEDMMRLWQNYIYFTLKNHFIENH